MTADDDRIAYLAGDDPAGGDALDPDEQADLDELRDLLADPLLWAEPPPELEADIVVAIRAAAAADPEAPLGDATVAAAPLAPPEAASGAAPPPLPAPTLLARRRKPGRAAFWGFVGGAAAAVVLLLGGLAVVRAQSSGPTLEAALLPTDLVPGASANVDLTRTDSGWRIELDATGLPRRDGGQFYEAWLRNEAGTLVSIGTFNEGTNVTLWAGVTPLEFTTITITEEEADGNPASSGRRVLTGPVTQP